MMLLLAIGRMIPIFLLQNLLCKMVCLFAFKRSSSLGRLGTQTVLISEKSFRNLTFDGADFADKTVYYPKFIARDSNARERIEKKFVTDILIKMYFCFGNSQRGDEGQ